MGTGANIFQELAGLDGEVKKYDSLGKTIESLDDLGFCMNHAVLVKTANCPVILIYEGWVYRNSFERFVVLPFDPSTPEFGKKFSDLIKAIFRPFTSFDKTLWRSSVNVEEIGDFSKQRCFNVSLVLYFFPVPPDEKVVDANLIERVITRVLNEVEDSHESISGTAFCLD